MRKSGSQWTHRWREQGFEPSVPRGRDRRFVCRFSFFRLFGWREPTRDDIERLVVSRGTKGLGGTGGSNPSSSSGESVSHTARAAAGREPLVSRGCAPFGWRCGRAETRRPEQNRAKEYNISVRPSVTLQSLRGKGIASLSRACTAKVRLAKDPYAEGAPGRLGACWA